MPVYRFGPYALDTRECVLRRDGVPVDAQPKTFEVLRYFVERPGRLVSREELLRGVWGDVHVGDQALTQMLRKARVALGDDVDNPRYLATVPKRGYRFVADVATDVGEPAAAARAAELVGREADLAGLLRLLHGPDAPRVITLVGPPGVGKSRLAREALAALDEVGGERSAPMSPGPPGAGALGTGSAGDTAAGWTLEDDADERLDALATFLSADPSPAGPGRLLVTSREALRVTGEQVWPVRPLPLAQAVELFLRRARAVLPDYAPDADEHDAIRVLAAELDGLPLALELAAARVRTMSARDLVRRLDQRLGWLRVDRRDVPPRARSMEASLDVSWRGLSDGERAALAALAALPEPWTVAEAEAAVTRVAPRDGPAAFTVVDALFGKSLVGRAEGGYRLLRCVRARAGNPAAAP